MPSRRRSSALTGVWWSATAPLTVVGTALAFLQVGAGTALVLTGFAGSVSALAVWQAHERARATGPAAGIAAAGLLGGVWALAAVGWVGCAGVAGLVLCVLVAAPGVLLRAQLRGAGRPPGAVTPGKTPKKPPGKERGGTAPPGAPPLESLPVVPLVPPSALPALSTADVCWIWRLSYSRVRRPGCLGYEVDDLAELRRACLDELERRDPEAFHRWLPTARAAGDPARAFCRQSAGS
jgi:hypothetical protein